MLYFWMHELGVTTPETSHKGGKYKLTTKTNKKKTYVPFFLPPPGWPSATFQEYKIMNNFQVFDALPGADGGIMSCAGKCAGTEPHRVPDQLCRSRSTSADSGE